MKKIISFITCIAMCMMLVIPVSASEIGSEEESVIIIPETSVYAYNNYFRKITPKLNSVFGNPSDAAKLSSGSISGTNPKITL